MSTSSHAAAISPPPLPPEEQSRAPSTYVPPAPSEPARQHWKLESRQRTVEVPQSMLPTV